MFTCDLITKVFEYEPVWGCQSEPDDYISKLTVDTHEKVELEQLKDRMLAAFMRTILNPKVEWVQIDTVSCYNKWPDEWGATRIEKRVTLGKPMSTLAELSKLEIRLDNLSGALAETYTRDGLSFKPADKNYLVLLKEYLCNDRSVQIVIHERSTFSPL